jgi:hypothetical protein
VALEEADGLGDLMTNANRGDSGDLFPGSTNNTTFDNASNPASLNNENESTMAYVVSISNAGNLMTAAMRAGFPAPALTSLSPTSGDNSAGTILVDPIMGTGFEPGAGFALRDSLGATYAASTVTWVGHGKLTAEMDLSSVPAGTYDVVVTNPDGQEAVLPRAFQVTGATGIPVAAPSRFALRQNHPNPFNPATTIPFDLAREARVSLRIYDVSGRLVRTLVDRRLPARHYEVRWEGRDDAGRPVASGVYILRMETDRGFRAQRKMVLVK